MSRIDSSRRPSRATSSSASDTQVKARDESSSPRPSRRQDSADTFSASNAKGGGARADTGEPPPLDKRDGDSWRQYVNLFRGAGEAELARRRGSCFPDKEVQNTVRAGGSAVATEGGNRVDYPRRQANDNDRISVEEMRQMSKNPYATRCFWLAADYHLTGRTRDASVPQDAEHLGWEAGALITDSGGQLPFMDSLSHIAKGELRE